MFVIIVLYNIKQVLENNNMTVYLYVKDEYIEQLQDFMPIVGMKYISISEKPANTIELFDCNDYIPFTPTPTDIGHYSNLKKQLNSRFQGYSQNRYYMKYLNMRLGMFNIPGSFGEFYYEDDELLQRYTNLEDKFKNLDIIIINSEPLSGQYYYNEALWEKEINKLHAKYKIITTKKIAGVPCTRDSNLKLKDIAAISTAVKVIIGINTGPLAPMLNKYTLASVKKFYIMDNRSWWSYPTFEMKQCMVDIPEQELALYCD